MKDYIVEMETDGRKYDFVQSVPNIKWIRSFTGFGLKEAKDLYDAAVSEDVGPQMLTFYLSEGQLAALFAGLYNPAYDSPKCLCVFSIREMDRPPSNTYDCRPVATK
jgi:hypothetical protein